jgi:hypothetical protein
VNETTVGYIAPQEVLVDPTLALGGQLEIELGYSADFSRLKPGTVLLRDMEEHKLPPHVELRTAVHYAKTREGMEQLLMNLPEDICRAREAWEEAEQMGFLSVLED